MTEVIYRKATENDIPQIIDLWKEFIDFHKNRDAFFSRSKEGPENFGKFIFENLQKDDATVYIAEANKRVIAYILCIIQNYPPAFETKKHGLVSDLAVTIKYRRKGIGEHLFTIAKNWFKENEITRIELEVAVTNEVSTSFWAKMGLKPYKSISYMEI